MLSILTKSLLQSWRGNSTMSFVSPLCHVSRALGMSARSTMRIGEDDIYLFDLNGYIIVRNVLTKTEVEQANKIISKKVENMVERSDPALRNTVAGTAFSGVGHRKDLGGVLEWGTDSRIFKSILAHPKLLPYFHTFLGKGFRMDHLPFCIIQDSDSEGFQLHGGSIDCTTGTYNPHLAYSYVHGTIQCALLGCNVMLVDHNEGDGGFCVVPGSHKSNFKMPSGMVDGERNSNFIVQPATRAGDVVLFSEGTVHGAKAWKSSQQRRTCLYRFAPATHAYGRSYYHPLEDNGEGGQMGWPSAMYEDMTDAERAVLEPPYANRLDRPNINDDGTSVEMTTRLDRKKEHDRAVFQTKYF